MDTAEEGAAEDIDGAESVLIHAATEEVEILPVYSAVESAIVQPVQVQYRIASRACLQVLVHELRLQDICRVLRCMLLDGSGGVLQSLADTLGDARATGWRLPGTKLQDALAVALRSVEPEQHDSISCRCAWHMLIAITVANVLHFPVAVLWLRTNA